MPSAAIRPAADGDERANPIGHYPMKTWSYFNLRCVAALLVASALPVLPVAAQTFVSPSLGSATSPAALGSAGTSTAPGFLSDLVSALSRDIPLYRVGPISFRPHVLGRIVNSTGVELGRPSALNTTAYTVAPGLLVQAGTHWEADYTPSWTTYSNTEFKNSFDQMTSASGTYDFKTWTVGASGSYSSLHPVLVEFARQSHEISTSVQWQSTLRLTDRTEISLSAMYDSRRAKPLHPTPDWLSSDTRNWSSTDTVRWQATDRLTVSAGAGFGYTDPTIGPSMSYLRPLVQLEWAPTERIRVDLKSGYERRRFYQSDAHIMNSPFYTGVVMFRPFSTTMVSAVASHGVSVSFLANSVTEIDTWKGEIQQRLFQMLYVSAGYMQQKTDYIEVHTNLPIARGDRYDTVDLRASIPFLNRGAVSVFFQRIHNQSSHLAYNFDTRQVGFDVNFRF